MGDFNNDNQLDIVVVNDYDNIDILLGYGNGSFAPRKTYSAGRRSISLSVGDFNNDNQLDIVVVGVSFVSGSVLLGYGNGSFAEYIPFNIDNLPTSVAVGDFNNDHRMDIVIGDSHGTVYVLLGYGNGSFAHQNTYLIVDGLNSVVVGDLNNDTRLDIVACESSVYVFLGDGHGSFKKQVLHSVLDRIEIIALVDFNNDYRLDIILLHNYHGSSRVGILLGDGAGSFGTETTYITGYDTSSAAVGDFNNDNRLDIVVTNGADKNIGVLIGYVNQMIARQMTLITDNNSRPRSFVINDFNNDNQRDIAVANSASHCIGIFLGYNNYSFTNQTTFDTGSDSSPQSIAAGDFNKDNYLDIVVANYGNDNIGVFLGDGNGSFSNQKTFTTGPYSQPYSVAVDDFNNDTFPDIIVANYGTNEVRVFVSDGNGAFADIIVISTGYGSHPFFVVTGDFNNDQKVDFAVANEGSDNLKIFLQTC